MRILYVYADQPHEWNCSEWRCIIPANAINADGRHKADCIYVAEFAQHQRDELVEATDLVIVQRLLVGEVMAACEYWTLRGKAVVCDFDDAYNLLPAYNPAMPYWYKGIVTDGQGKQLGTISPVPIQQFEAGLQRIAGAITPSRLLSSDYARLCNVWTVPNFYDAERFVVPPVQKLPGLTIGYGASATHFRSVVFSNCSKAVYRILRDRQGVNMLLCGVDPGTLMAVADDVGRVHYAPRVGPREWPRNLAKFDVGIAPLDGAFDDRRSWIKILEYCALGIPWVASDRPPYQDFSGWESGILVKNTERAWVQALGEILDHIDLWRTKAHNDRERVKQWSIQRNVDTLIKTYQEIVASVKRN